MSNINRYHIILRTCVTLFMVGFFLYGSRQLFALSYVCAYIFVVMRAISIPSKKRLKLFMIVSYSFLLILLIYFNRLMDLNTNTIALKPFFSRLFSVAGIMFPFVIERFFVVNKYVSFYMPSLQDFSTFSFNEIRNNKQNIISTIENLKKIGNSVSLDNIEDIVTDLPRHNSFRYINDGTLTEDYFNEAYATLNDPRIYIVVSNTGSAASELISVFTKKQYNHASLSFDADLKTILSYNGGERAYPPGLNREMIEYFNKKDDASIIVYALEAAPQQKKMIIDKINEINNEGRAYNIMGLILKYSHKSNIMFCSQFVYKMLKYANLQYFEKKDTKITPADLVEMDYHRKLSYVYEIDFKMWRNNPN